MWQQYRHMNLLYAHGHAEAHTYPFGYMWDQAILITERVNNVVATEAVLLHQAVSAVLSKKAQKEFDKTIKKLQGDGFK